MNDEVSFWVSMKAKISDKKMDVVGTIVGVLITVVFVMWQVSSNSVTSRAEELLKEIIQEKILEENKIDEFIALNEIENLDIKKAAINNNQDLIREMKNLVDNVKMWEGTVNVTYKTKQGIESFETFKYDVIIKEKNDELLVECKPNNEELFSEKFGVLLTKAGYVDYDSLVFAVINETVKKYDDDVYPHLMNAFDRYTLLAKNGDARSQYMLAIGSKHGIFNNDSSNSENVKYWCWESAKQGYPPAECMVGDMYKEGVLVGKDKKEALRWYRKAAAQGLAQGQLEVGSCYYNGIGVSADKTEAVKWFQKSAEQGHAIAQYNLASCFELGEGVEKNETEAYRWYRKAAQGGHVRSQAKLGFFLFSGIGTSVNKKEASDWFLSSAKQGDGVAQYNLGFCYEYGEGVVKDEEAAFSWYEKACENNQIDAQYKVAVCYEKGIGVMKDRRKAFWAYRDAADCGHRDAAYKAGLMLYDAGFHHDNDLWYSEAIFDAIQYLSRAAQKGHAEAKSMLEKAAKQGSYSAQQELKKMK